MLKTCLFVRTQITTFLVTERDVTITDREWDELEEVYHFLEIFATATDFTTVEKLPTLSATLPVHHYIMKSLLELATSETSSRWISIKEAALQARLKFQKYHPVEKGLPFLVATCLDPRFGLNFFEPQQQQSIRDIVYQRLVLGYGCATSQPAGVPVPKDPVYSSSVNTGQGVQLPLMPSSASPSHLSCMIAHSSGGVPGVHTRSIRRYAEWPRTTLGFLPQVLKLNVPSREAVL